MRNWGMFWAAFAGITRGVLYLVPHQVAVPSALDAAPDLFLVGFGVVWLLAGVWALAAAVTGRFGFAPALAIVSLSVGWAAAYAAATPVYGPAALSGVATHIVLAGLVWTKSKVAVVQDGDR